MDNRDWGVFMSSVHIPRHLQKQSSDVMLSRLRILMVSLGDMPDPDAPVDTGGRTNGALLRRLREITEKEPDNSDSPEA